MASGGPWNRGCLCRRCWKAVPVQGPAASVAYGSLAIGGVAMLGSRPPGEPGASAGSSPASFQPPWRLHLCFSFSFCFHF